MTDQLDENILQDLKTNISNLASKVYKKALKVIDGLNYEKKETIFMLETFFRALKAKFAKNPPVTEDDVKRALFQLKDVGKFALIVPIFLLPGGGTTTTVLYLTAKKYFGISILPKGLEQVFQEAYNQNSNILIDVQSLNEEMSSMEHDKGFDLTSFLTESGLSRLWRKTDSYTTGAITAFRGDASKSTNKSNNKKLLAFLMNRGYSVTKVQGSYVENYGSSDEAVVSEESWFVSNEKVEGDDGGELERDLRRLGEYFDQDSVLIVPHGGRGAKLIGTSKRSNAFPEYGKSEVVGNAKFGVDPGEFFSRVKGRAFAFESIETITLPATANGRRAMKVIGEKLQTEIEKVEYECN